MDGAGAAFATLNMSMKILLPSSKLQASIASGLETYRRLYLQQALAATIRSLELTRINAELDAFEPANDLKQLASRGIRGEFVFAVPCVLASNPRLLGYYRLLLGFSQKEFDNKGKLGRFKALEEENRVPDGVAAQIEPLCSALIERASTLIHEIGADKLTLDLLDDLALLTLGPQLRGGINTQIGRLANRAVFELIESVVAHAIRSSTPKRSELVNASKRKVVITFSSDPDIGVEEEISPRKLKKIVAIEIKGGSDKSNIWNRLGEAEKSHQSAKQRGFVEFWTIYNVLNLNLAKAREKSPTTNRFYSLPELLVPKSEDFHDFRDRLVSLVGIRTPAPCVRSIARCTHSHELRSRHRRRCA